MQQIFYFFAKNKTFFLFLILLFTGVMLTVHLNYYHQSKFFNSANAVSGGVYKAFNRSSDYFSLKIQNKKLLEENENLRKELLNYKAVLPQKDYFYFSKECYTVVSARVVKNSIGLYKNYITIDEGSNQNIEGDMGVISSKGVVGIIERTSSNYATVQSVLNTRSQLNVKLKKSNHFGSLRWNGKELNRVQVVDIPKIAKIAVGDTIITGGMSSIFPEGVPVGTIQEFFVNNYDNSYNIEVKLFTDMSDLDYVYVLGNQQRQEVLELQSKEEDD